MEVIIKLRAGPLVDTVEEEISRFLAASTKILFSHTMMMHMRLKKKLLELKQVLFMAINLKSSNLVQVTLKLLISAIATGKTILAGILEP